MALILGIDPGSRITGYGLVRYQAGRVAYVASGCIRVSASSLPERLEEIFASVQELIRNHEPDELAIEAVFMARNPDSALKLGQARGAAIVAARVEGLTVTEYAARRVKQALVGKGSADKVQVQHMVCALLGLPARPQADAADALAIALCHAHSTQGGMALRAASSRRRLADRGSLD